MNTTAKNLPTYAIHVTRFKDGNEDYFRESESLYLSNGVAYSELYLSKPTITLNSGNYETQLHITSVFNGYECNPAYHNFLIHSHYLGIQDGNVILQSTLQKMAYYRKW